MTHKYRPSNYYTLGLRFRSIEVNGREVPVALVSVNHGKLILPEQLEAGDDFGLFTFQISHLTLDQKFVSEWRTAR